ncbi:cupin domain-containing protein [Burkholderia vietnamiensis]|uniref:cupin domain-containing protein n=1 Tax=Burkholderia vietnamiensis TaxID=60552 RepID=UPI00264C4B98|nr:cupin domain-containing protein [Burkholderia vietnamiensis]MDN8037075.1 cupin domain-containing protein [Burkholderia vietnamiensis]
MPQAMQRIVTGHDNDGKSVVTHEGNPPTVVELQHAPGTVFYELWSTQETPAPVDNGDDPTLGPLSLPPPKNGTRVRVVEIPPDTEDFLKHGAARMKKAFIEIGDAHASTVTEDSPHPLMHRTESIDYGFVLEGEIFLVLDREERLLKQGDVVVQRGTNHAWANRSTKPCRMAFILVSGEFSAELS